MPRTRGTAMGPVRSMRLPQALDAWLETRLAAHPHRSVSDLLVELVHGGLRLRDGYMSIHRYALEARVQSPEAYATYRASLLDTFGEAYVEHLERWLEAEGVSLEPRFAQLTSPSARQSEASQPPRNR